jgi:LmbE family N-acetylglucosaminyl deacetylase
MSIVGKCGVVVAHPDDETLWVGGTMLMHPDCRWTVVTLCRGSDSDRAPRFFKALKEFNATGAMGDLDDGPQQDPLPSGKVQDCIMELLSSDRFDAIFTHGLRGEYTRHLRHEEVAKAVLALRRNEILHSRELFTFAYHDGGGEYLPRTINDADLTIELPRQIWQHKHDIITGIYGFDKDSFEARTTPKQEAFWQFGSTNRK